MAKARKAPVERPHPDAAAALDEQRAGWKTFDIAVVLGLLISILAVYGQVGAFEFINYDDNLYVYENPHVQGGLTRAIIPRLGERRAATLGLTVSTLALVAYGCATQGWMAYTTIAVAALSGISGVESATAGNLGLAPGRS